MDQDEFEKRHGKRYSTIIFLPHAKAKFRKLKVSHRLVFSLVSLIASSLALSVFFSMMYFTRVRESAPLRSASTLALEWISRQPMHKS